MTDEEYCQNWRQARVFSSNTTSLWYPTLLGSVLKPVAEEFPSQKAFFSQYVLPLGQDDGDTNIDMLPERFLQRVGEERIHRSIRVRFRRGTGAEDRVTEILGSSSEYWYSGIRDYGIKDDLGGPRFSPNQEERSRLRRARLVAELLCCNSRLVLDAMIRDGDRYRFEENGHELNRPLGSTFRSVGHIVSQVWVDHGGGPLPIFVEIPGHMCRL